MQFLVNPPKKGFLSAAIMLSRHCLVAASSQSSAVFQIPHWPWAVSSLAHMTSISRQHSAKNYPWLHCRGGGDDGGAAAAMAAAAPTSAAGKSQLWPSRKNLKHHHEFIHTHSGAVAPNAQVYAFAHPIFEPQGKGRFLATKFWPQLKVSHNDILYLNL